MKDSPNEIPIFTENQVAEAIHKDCLTCASYFTPAQEFEVQNCKAYTCPLYQHRMGLKEKP